MAVLYPPAQPSISGDVVTISRFLNNPTLVARRLRTLAGEDKTYVDVMQVCDQESLRWPRRVDVPHAAPLGLDNLWR